MKTHKDLNVWQESIKLVTLIYEKTKTFPKDELFALTSQIKRSAISIPSNISEGAARESNKEFLRFLFIAQGSISELDTQLLIAHNLSFLSKEDYIQIDEKLTEIRKMLAGLIKFRKAKSIQKSI
jgi:four helix bundle protein